MEEKKEKFFVSVVKNKCGIYSLRCRCGQKDYGKDCDEGEKQGDELIICFILDNRDLVKEVLELSSRFIKGKIFLSELEQEVEKISN